MANELKLYGAESAVIEVKRGNYEISGVMGGTDVTLRRGIDFDTIPRTKQPSLLKPGAEAICKAYGVFQRYTIEEKRIIDDPPSFTFVIRCDLIKINPVDGKEWVVANGLAAASTNEKRNGFNGAYDALNSTVKMAEKRALVCAAINLAGASSLFCQDMDNESFMSKADDLKNNEGENAPISAKQVKRIFALAAQAGYSTEDAKQKFQAAGFTSTKDITQAQYDFVCSLFTNGEKGNN